MLLITQSVTHSRLPVKKFHASDLRQQWLPGHLAFPDMTFGGLAIRFNVNVNYIIVHTTYST